MSEKIVFGGEPYFITCLIRLESSFFFFFFFIFFVFFFQAEDGIRDTEL